MALFVMDVSFQMVVEAGNQLQAMEVTKRHVGEAAGDVIPHVILNRTVLVENQLPLEWDGDCLPYGGNGNDRIKDILGAQHD